jgi:hypothetical protein
MFPIVFHLQHRAEADDGLAAREREENTFRKTDPAPTDLKEKLERAAANYTRDSACPGGRQPSSSSISNAPCARFSASTAAA